MTIKPSFFFAVFNSMDRILEDDRVASIRAAVLHRLAEDDWLILAVPHISTGKKRHRRK